jgi:16S rRNA C967 or C1407 C5-methylase (RsmB/RsmF family)
MKAEKADSHISSLAPFFGLFTEFVNHFFAFQGKMPADRVFQDFSRRLRSHERRALATLFYTFLRHFWWCVWKKQLDEEEPLITKNGDLAAFSRFLPPLLDLFCTHFPNFPNESAPFWARGNIAPYLWSEWERSFSYDSDRALQEAEALQREAPLDLRVNIFAGFSRSAVLRELCADGFFVEDIPQLPYGLRLFTRAPLQHHSLFKKGAFEIQGAASQHAVQFFAKTLLSEKRRQTLHILDYCAGSGGKSLALINEFVHHSMNGSVTLTDLSEHRLSQAHKRFYRFPCSSSGGYPCGFPASVHILPLSELSSSTSLFHGVLVDVPCSGIGTLRRNPDKAIFFSSELFSQQLGILQKASSFVHNGGVLAYMTCSLLRCENEDVLDAFLEKQVIPWIFEDSVTFSPAYDNADGFFVALLRKPS